MAGIGLNVDHDIQPIRDRWRPIGAGLILLGAFGLTTIYPTLAPAMTLMVISPLLIYPLIVLPDPIAEHRAYVSMAGFAILGAELYRTAPYVVYTIVLSYFAYRTLQRQHAWSDGIHLWSQAYADGSRKPRVLSNLNWAYQSKGNLVQGEYWARETLKIAPHCFPVHYNLSRIAEDVGKLPEAIQIMEEAVKVTPIWQAYKRLGQIYEIAGQFDKALDAYVKVVFLNRKEADTYNQIGSIYFRKQQPDEALHHFELAHRLDSTNVSIMYNLGMVAMAKKDKETARIWLAKLGPNAMVPPELKQLCAG